jgi:plasmid maintenance system killer protein
MTQPAETQVEAGEFVEIVTHRRLGPAILVVNRQPTVYKTPVIKRFRHKGLESLFLTGSTKGVDAQLAGKLRRMLLRLNDGPLPNAMMLPGTGCINSRETAREAGQSGRQATTV